MHVLRKEAMLVTGSNWDRDRDRDRDMETCDVCDVQVVHVMPLVLPGLGKIDLLEKPCYAERD